MTRKTALIISGKPFGKNLFSQAVRNLNEWVWNVSYMNVLTKVAGLLGWDGDKNSKFYGFCIALLELANEYYNFQHNYIFGLTEKFMRDEKATLLVIHGIDKDTKMITELEEKHDVKTLHIYDEKPLTINQEYDYVLDASSDGFTDGLKNILDVIE